MEFTFEVGDVVNIKGQEFQDLTIEKIHQTEYEAAIIWFDMKQVSSSDYKGSGKLNRDRVPLSILKPSRRGN